MKRLLWYAYRLRVMSGGEIASRLQQKLRELCLERRGLSRQITDISVPTEFKLPLRFSSFPEHLREYFTRQFAPIAQRAAGAERNVFSLLGLPAHDFGERIDWYKDPVTGQRWPDDVSAFRIDYRHQQKLGEVKYVWELGRMPWLLPRAVAAYLHCDARVAQGVLDDILSFIHECPPFRGIHWTSGLELAVRITNWTWALALIQNTVKISGDQWYAISEYIAVAAHYCMRFLSRFSSANNHLIGEATGLLIAGMCWPVFPWHREAARKGIEILRSEIPRQILPDGSSVEISPQYLAEVLEWSLCCAAVLRCQDEEIPREWVKRWQACARFLRTVSCGDRMPALADSDDAQILPLGLELTPTLLAGVLERAAGVLSPAACTEEVEFASWLFQVPTFEPNAIARDATTDATRGTVFLPSGLFVVTGENSKLLADFASHGLAPLYAHAHADALSLTLSTAEEDILIDPGTFCYHGERRWRDWFRATKAHNTVELNDENQSEIRGSFLWGRVARTWLERWTLGQVCECEASHDGYAPIVHQRRITYAGGDRYVVRDVVFTRKTRESRVDKVVIWWHFAPGELDLKENHIRWRGCSFECRLTWQVSKAEWTVERYFGNEEKPQGWYSPRFSARFPSPAVGIVLKDVALPVVCETEIEIAKLRCTESKEKQT
ncbi:MAG: heparinase II/III family protein [Candidatus Sumerlaeaceae bacterium]|nr:heparinase II/III family protein [Candidatus Sumerlaeaceae bacterium]